MDSGSISHRFPIVTAIFDKSASAVYFTAMFAVYQSCLFIISPTGSSNVYRQWATRKKPLEML
jgi:hypothetical protein